MLLGRRVPVLRTLAGLVVLSAIGLGVVSCAVRGLLGVPPSPGSSASPSMVQVPQPSPTPTRLPGAGTVRNVEPLSGPYEVVRVVDGDTVRLALPWGEESVRLIGIDTPETVHPTVGVECYGPEASAYAKRLMTGTSVWLEYDESQGQRDRYDRLLAYIWLTPARLYNLLAIEEGYATEYTYNSAYAHREDFLAAQALARSHLSGLWGACPAG